MIIWVIALIIVILVALLNLVRLFVNHDAHRKPWQAGISTIIAGICAIVMVMSIDQYYRAEEFIERYDRAKLSAYWIDSIDPTYEQYIFPDVVDVNFQLNEYQKHPLAPWYPDRLRHLKPISLKQMDTSVD